MFFTYMIYSFALLSPKNNSVSGKKQDRANLGLFSGFKVAQEKAQKRGRKVHLENGEEVPLITLSGNSLNEAAYAEREMSF